MYVSAGFKEPYITDVDPWNNPLNFNFVSLHKPINNYITDESQTVITYNKTMDLYNQFKLLEKNPDYTCIFSFTLDKSAILRLRMFPYLGVQGITNISKANLQREFAGIFNIYSTSLNESEKDNTILYKLSLETLAENRGIKYIIGEEESATPDDYAFTFHTHPISLYVKYNVLIGPPSGPDVKRFVEKVITTGEQFHMVVAIEGIYIISLASNFILKVLQKPDILKKFLETPNILNTISNNAEYPFSKRYFDWNTDVELPQDTVAKMIQEYLTWIKNVTINNVGPIVELQFFPWNKIDKKTVFSIHYASIYNNCFANSKSVLNFKNIHGINRLFNYTRN